MVQQGIKELDSLYKEMAERFKNIRVDYVDDITTLEKDILKDMQVYFAEVLAIIPRNMHVYMERLVIQFYKNEYYKTEDGESGQTDAVVIVDRDVYKNNMVLDSKNVGKRICNMDKPAEELDLRTFQYMCSMWQDIKEEIHYQIVEDMEDRIKSTLDRIKKKKEDMSNLENWKV